MSFDIYLQCFQNGEPEYFNRAIFEEIFRRDAIGPDNFPSRVVYADGGAEIYVDSDKEIDGFMTNHCGGDTFFTALFELADRTGGVVFWPDEGRTMAVTKPEVIDQLPEDMIESLGRPFIVRSGHELQDVIREQVDPPDSASSA